MSEAPETASRGTRGERVTRRTRLIAAGAGLVMLAAVVGAAAVVVGSPRSSGLGPPHYVDETAHAGISHIYGGDETYQTGGGVAVFDCDADGRPDVYLAGGGNQAALYRNESPTGGDLRFAPVRDPATDLEGVTGAYPLDVDGDGIVDLAVLRVGESVLLRGLGGCRFERANEAWGVAPARALTTAFSATWEAGASAPTLAFGNYMGLDDTGEPTSRCVDNEVFRPDAMAPTYGPPIPLAPGYCPLSMLFSDWDGSGRRDLRISNDRHYYDNEVGQEQLWRFEPDKTPSLYTEADGWALVRIWGMGIASYDVTGDGLPEVYLTSQGANRLQTLIDGPGKPTFGELALERHIEATRPVVGGDPLPSTAWHPEFQDVNNDGLMDLFVSKGNVGEVPDYAVKDPSNLFLGRPDGMYTEASEAAGIVSFDRGRGAALADFNQDGLLDLVEVFLGAPVRVWRNAGAGTIDAPAPMGNWLGLRLRQAGGNRDAIGAIIESKVGDAITRRETSVGGGHVGGQLGWTHLGLGPATEAQVRVTWPDGEAGPWMTIAANQFVDIERGAAGPTPWTPPGS